MDKNKLALMKEDVKKILDKPYKTKFYEDDELVDEVETEDDDLDYIDDDPENYIDTEGVDMEDGMDDMEITETPLDYNADDSIDNSMESGMEEAPTIESINSKVDMLMDKIEELASMLMPTESDEDLEDEDDFSDEEEIEDAEDFEDDIDEEEDFEDDEEEDDEDF
jgi:hypothetical protein